MEPYFQEAGVTIYHGDAREILPSLSAESIITDPVWPNSVFPNVPDPQKLLTETLVAVSDMVQRVVIHLGIDSDPRFLAAVPGRWPFIRVCDLDYARPTYKGKIMMGGDVAYAFGEIPKLLGRHVLPGRCISTRSDKLFHRSTWIGKDKHFIRRKDLSIPEAAELYGGLVHPCARRLQHVRWLCKWFAGASVIDPFGGSGTTAVACKALGIPCTLIEIEERFCELAVKRLAQGALDLHEASA